MGTLEERFAEASPRLRAAPTPWRSLAIHGAVVVLWIVLFARAFALDGVVAWSVGVVYVLYDTGLQVFVVYQTLDLLGGVSPDAATMPRPSLEVLVAARNERIVLPRTLAALLAQSDPPDAVTIVDDGSTDATTAWLAETFGLPPPPLNAACTTPVAGVTLRWLRLPHQGKARALNAALVHGACELVVTVDADTLLDVGAIAAMRAAFATEPALVAATGVLVPTCGPSLSGRLLQWLQTYEYIRNFLSRRAWMRLDSLLLISGAFAGYRREALLAVGGYDPACLVEDYEVIHRLRRFAVLSGRPWRTAVLGTAVAHTEAPGTPAAFLRQRRRWFGGFLQTQFWYREMVGDRRYGWLGTAMLPVKAVDTLQPIYGLTAVVIFSAALIMGSTRIAAPVAGIVAAKIVLDFAFHLWSLHVYRRWVGAKARTDIVAAVLAALIEPFSFQLLRHLGAAWGWVVFLSGRGEWGMQTRGIQTREDPVPNAADGPAPGKRGA